MYFSSSYVSKGTLSSQASFDDYPASVSKHDSHNGSPDTGLTIKDDTVRVRNQTRYFNGSSQETKNSNTTVHTNDNSGVGCYNISQFSAPNSSRHPSGFPSHVPLPSSTNGIHRRSRSSAVLMRAQKFESRLQQQQQQQQHQHQQSPNHYQRSVPTRSSNERLGQSTWFVPIHCISIKCLGR